MRILIIEDEPGISLSVTELLKPAYAVDTARTGKEGIYQAEVTPYDLILLDLGLPDMGGIEVCERLRKAGITAPILILTGRSDIRDKIQAFNAYADDYLTKPFHSAELIARIRALIRRGASAFTPDILRVSDLVVDTVNRTAMRGTQDIKLSRKEFDLLECLMRYQGRALSRAEILEHVWDREADSLTNFIDVTVKYLRDKIDKPFPTKLIKTVYGYGYKIEDEA